ncbi:MAG: alpha/beta fold hydrolase [Myxococcota bacterium]
MARLHVHTLRTEPAPLFHDAAPQLPAGNAIWLYARSGRRLRSARFAPPTTVRGSVILSPGRTEPIEKYQEVIADLVARGYHVLVHDWAGQGLSQRFLPDSLAGDVEGSFQALLADYTDIVSKHAAELPRPWIVVGHSMGGALSAAALADASAHEVFGGFDAAALCAPMMEFSTGQIPIRAARRIVSVAMRAGFGTRLVRRQTDPFGVSFETNVLTHDRTRYERMQTLYRAHPELVIGEPTWRWLQFGLDLRAHLASPGVAERIQCPLVAVGAGEDRVVRNEPIRRFTLRTQRGVYREVAGAFHEILMETDARRARFFQVFDELARAF